MKKEYKKPIAVIETFQLDAAVAGSCKEDAETLGEDYEKLGYAPDSCVWCDGAAFNHSNCQLDVTGSGGDSNDSVCYHGPIEGIVFINS